MFRVDKFPRVERVSRPTTVCPWYTIRVSWRWKQRGTGSVVYRCSLRFPCCTITYLRLLCSATELWRESSYSSTLTATPVSYYLDAINIREKLEFGRCVYIYIYIYTHTHTHTHTQNIQELAKITDFLGAFVKLRRATISYIMSVCPHRTTRLPLEGFTLNLTLEYFSTICRENPSFIKIWQE